MQKIITVRDVHNEEIRIVLTSMISYRQAGKFIEIQTAAGYIQFEGDVNEFDNFLADFDFAWIKVY